ncbi:MAG: hypothetical protein JOY90_30910 [Bradyrhizobium sp.]|uniref:hypothetical protein n=1 Tax=Bradyrhizobium sp. TaxID=376 RepID=UPI001D655DFA|nr:hypothetical protein [Bradyrhizobium sp.]MBV9564822.1 hypothetical protein [Bradyrhizobium sp.]
MIKRRRRFKQTTTLEERLLKYTTDLQQQVRTLQPGTVEAAELRKKIRNSEAERSFNALLHEER